MVCCSSFVQATLVCGLTVSFVKCSWTPGSFPEWSLQPAFFVLLLHISSTFIPQNHLSSQEKQHLLRTVRVNKWVRGFHYAPSVFKAYTLVGWHFWSLLCKMWRQRQPFATSISTHGVWPALQYTPSSISFLLLPVTDVSLYTDIHTQCRMWVLCVLNRFTL